MCEQVQRLDDDVHRERGIEAEGFVADYFYAVCHLFGEVVGNERYEVVGTHKDGDVALSDSLVDEFADDADQIVERLLPVVLGRQQSDADESIVGPRVGHLLRHFLIGACQLLGFGHVVQ